MEFRDFLLLLKRGWPTILVALALALLTAASYLALAPKTYQTSTTMLVAANEPVTISDAQQGLDLASRSASTIAALMNSAVILGPAGEQLNPTMSAAELSGMVAVSSRDQTSIIDVHVSSTDPTLAAEIANQVAETAVTVAPGLQSGEAIRLSVVQAAAEPLAPASPNSRNIIAIAVIVGLSLGLAIAITIQALDSRLRRLEDVTSVTSIPVLSVLPRRKKHQKHQVVVRDDPSSLLGEAYRVLRTNLGHLETDGGTSLIVTDVQDGRTSAAVAVDLAWSIAQAGRTVALVDLDLRHSNIVDTLGLRHGEGIANVLAGQIELGDVVQPTKHGWLDVIPPGTIDLPPSDLLTSAGVKSAIEDLEKAYAYVIVAAPPLLYYADAAVIARSTGVALVTLAAGRTTAASLTSAITVLHNVNVEPLGLILDDVPASTRVRQFN